MADFSHSDDLELQELNEKVHAHPEEFEHWEKLIRAAEAQEGGLNRNSSPGAITATRDTYDRFLARFPLFFGYWKKYADLEFVIGGTESAEMVYERGVASIGISVDLWANYCAFKVETCHDTDVIRELFDRGAGSVGFDFLAHPFWDKYIEFEERLENHDRIFSILSNIIHIPLHQYARYFERYRVMATKRPIHDLLTKEITSQLSEELVRVAQQPIKDAELERELRARIDELYYKVFLGTQEQTSKRWTYEQEIKRPYYHVTELDDAQLNNWRKYLDFEESQGDYERTKFLYERCVVTTANYDEFWYRYARWTMAQTEIAKEVRSEEVRNIFRRASCTYVYIPHPEIRLHYARFEESLGKADTAIAIHESILYVLPAHIDTILSLIHTYRRHDGIDTAIEVLKGYLSSTGLSTDVRGALVAEHARLVWKIKGDVQGARDVFHKSQQRLLECKTFWVKRLQFESDQPTAAEEGQVYQRVKAVYEDIRHNSVLPQETVKELASQYLRFLEERGGEDAMAEWIEIDKEINGPPSVASALREKGTVGAAPKQRRTKLENGH